MYKDELVKLVSSKTGLNEEMATLAVDTVIGFLKQKLPPELSGQLESLLSGQESSSGIMDTVKGIIENMNDEDKDRINQEMISDAKAAAGRGGWGAGDRLRRRAGLVHILSSAERFPERAALQYRRRAAQSPS